MGAAAWKESIERLRRKTGAFCAVDFRGATSAAFLVAESSEPDDPADRFWLSIDEQWRGNVLVAGSAYDSVNRANRSLKQAYDTLRVLEAFHIKAGRLSYTRVGGLALIAASEESAEFTSFSLATLKPVFDYDAKRSGDLFVTLVDYFRLNHSVTETARARYVHPNSIYYRLKKIENLTRLHLNESTERLQLELATLVAQLSLDPPA